MRLIFRIFRDRTVQRQRIFHFLSIESDIAVLILTRNSSNRGQIEQ